MFIEMSTFFAILAALLAGIGIGMGIREFRHMRERIAALERAQAKHLPYHTAEEIENATAAVNRIMFELDLKREFVDNALNHLKAARGKK